MRSGCRPATARRFASSGRADLNPASAGGAAPARPIPLRRDDEIDADRNRAADARVRAGSHFESASISAFSFSISESVFFSSIADFAAAL
jgi:hypothetical protein